MKKLVLILAAVAGLLLVGVDSYAQSKKVKAKPEPVKLDPMFYKGGKFIVGYDTIDASLYRNYFTPEEFQRVNKALQLRKNGMWTMIAGGATLGVAAVCMGVGNALYMSDDSDISKTGYGIWWGGVGALCAGSALLVSGVPVFCVGDARLKKAADGYNKRNNINIAYLTVTPAGLALRF